MLIKKFGYYCNCFYICWAQNEMKIRNSVYLKGKIIFCFNCCSLRADEIKLWLTPSAKQRRNPCSGLPAVYPDLSTHHDWPVKKDLCFVCRKTGNSQSG